MDVSARMELEKVFRAGLAAVDPEAAVRRHLGRDGDVLLAGGQSYALSTFRSVFLAGAGKGTAPMAKAVEACLGDALNEGVIVVKYGHGLPLQKTRVMEAGHPVPDPPGVAGALEVLRLVQRAGPEDLVVCAFSGGGSALLPAPAPPLSLEEKQAVTRLLLECGAAIHEINAVRKHLSRLKGGNLARGAFPARTLSLFLSDVVGDPPDAIASGPTAPDPTTFADCLNILKKYGIDTRLPSAARKVLEEGLEGRRPETPKPGDAVFSRVQNLVVGNNRAALAAAADAAHALGFRPVILTSLIQGEAREVARVLAAVALEIAVSGNPVPPPACVLAGGETTVTVSGDGQGGRNQELALAAALDLDGRPGITVLAAGTDGTDGPTDAAGAFADGSTVSRGHALGLDAGSFLRRNDAYTFFDALGDLLRTGPTRTNVMDFVGVLVKG